MMILVRPETRVVREALRVRTVNAVLKNLPAEFVWLLIRDTTDRPTLTEWVGRHMGRGIKYDRKTIKAEIFVSVLTAAYKHSMDVHMWIRFSLNNSLT